MDFKREGLSDQQLAAIYRSLLLPRMIEEKMLILLRQGRVSKWFSGIGQEAISVGVTLAIDKDEFILPLHRNLGVFTTRDIPLVRLFAQLEGKKDGFTKGRDRSFHFGSIQHHIVGMISHLGPQLGIADGIALACKLGGEKKVTLVFTGDGGASEGDFHEAVNVAAVWDLPVIFLVENNGYGLSTPSSEQFRHKYFIDKGPGYGIEAVQVDGNNILEVYHSIRAWSEKIRKDPRPVLVEAITFRVRGHEEASGTKYVPKELIDQWALKDPVENFENYLFREKILNKKGVEEIKKEFRSRIEAALKEVSDMPDPQADSEEELGDIYTRSEDITESQAKVSLSEMRYVDAITDGLKESMRRHKGMVIMGQDIAEYGGVFKVTEGMLEEFGKERIRNTPLCESAILGVSLGLSVKGIKSVVEMQFADFVTLGFNQIVNNLAKVYYRWGQPADVVIRMPAGAGVNAGPFHSQSNEGWFFQTPGLKIVYPSDPAEAKGLMISAIDDPNPVMFFEHKALYRSVRGMVPEGYYKVPIGTAKVAREGEDITIITYGMGVIWAQKAVAGINGKRIEIIDLRTLLPWDMETVERSVKKTGRVLILHEASLTGGIGGEIAAWIGEHCFEYLDAPVMRVGSLDTPVPFSKNLEENFLPEGRLIGKLNILASY